jgi:hypothetical protein
MMRAMIMTDMNKYIHTYTVRMIWRALMIKYDPLPLPLPSTYLRAAVRPRYAEALCNMTIARQQYTPCHTKTEDRYRTQTAEGRKNENRKYRRNDNHE